jgi:uncharacterized membrane protein YqaE (UPF0057 family)
MKKIIYISMAVALLSSCTGVAPFSKAKYGHLKWIKKGGASEQSNDEKTANEKTENNAEKTFSGPEVIQPSLTNNSNIEEQNTVDNFSTDKQNLPVVKQTASAENQTSVVTDADVKNQHHNQTRVADKKSPGSGMSDMAILAIVLAILLPPVGVYITRETSSPFVLCLVLCLLAGVGYWFFWYSGLLWLIAVIVALIAVLQDV